MSIPQFPKLLNVTRHFRWSIRFLTSFTIAQLHILGTCTQKPCMLSIGLVTELVEKYLWRITERIRGKSQRLSTSKSSNINSFSKKREHGFWSWNYSCSCGVRLQQALSSLLLFALSENISIRRSMTFYLSSPSAWALNGWFCWPERTQELEMFASWPSRLPASRADSIHRWTRAFGRDSWPFSILILQWSNRGQVLKRMMGTARRTGSLGVYTAIALPFFLGYISTWFEEPKRNGIGTATAINALAWGWTETRLVTF